MLVAVRLVIANIMILLMAHSCHSESWSEAWRRATNHNEVVAALPARAHAGRSVVCARCCRHVGARRVSRACASCDSRVFEVRSPEEAWCLPPAPVSCPWPRVSSPPYTDTLPAAPRQDRFTPGPPMIDRGPFLFAFFSHAPAMIF